jgi:hypothetical protein
VTDQHDPVDTWLERDVRPLMPREGTLDRIRHKARRRKRAQVLMATAGCAVVVAGVATAPQLTAALRSAPAAAPAPTSHSAGVGKVPGVAAPSLSSPSVPQSAHASRLPERTHLSAGQVANDPVPPNFRPTSVTFVGNGSGGAVGAVIGQAGPKCATKYCTSLAQTPDYGASWSGLSAPLVGAPSGTTGVSQVRFLDLKFGWAFGPGLWETANGGWPWTPEDTNGMRVTDLEAAGQTAFAVFASCAGTGSDYASSCTSFRLYTSGAGQTAWTPVAVPASFQAMTSPVPSAVSLVISGGTTGYLLTPSGQVLSGPVGGGAWTLAGQAPCSPGPAQADGSPANAQLAAGADLLLACDAGHQVTLHSSADGKTWKTVTVLPVTGQPTSLGVNSTGQAVLATTAGRYYSADSGRQWRAASVPGSPAGGFSYVGMTNATQGVALPADASLGEIFVTANGGRTWKASAVRGR